ncbi:hypothetical protein BGW36DRAFT_210156 [Talaromyces proteolyticus]|uniref:Uncharacterized protein n=1 Tax=Talaromyces proteolyticus TaxID=1131652 RepID=A0AAD4KLA8_9EURO|nr:uncharacterized protein BGW36DRAFT_210156 [Talaromyces proteolyticus]KAH8693756.1 hypothetical protein BGW36DRAFT_210156 [Talaromyces proteolyticus]
MFVHISAHADPSRDAMSPKIYQANQLQSMMIVQRHCRARQLCSVTAMQCNMMKTGQLHTQKANANNTGKEKPEMRQVVGTTKAIKTARIMRQTSTSIVVHTPAANNHARAAFRGRQDNPSDGQQCTTGLNGTSRRAV